MKRIHGFMEIIRNIGIKSVVAATLIFVMTVAVTGLGAYQLYNYTKDNILLQGEINALKSAREFDLYLGVRKNAVALAGHVVDQMLKEGKSEKEILEYLEMESESIRDATDNDSTGLYGWIDGKYYDGDGWVPDDDYVPTERPWYIETIADDSDVTFVKPYLDEQYKVIMTTMAAELSDKKSVLAIDVSLEQIQNMTANVGRQTEDSYGIMLDKTGQVIAHSIPSELGKNYMEEKGTLGSVLAQKELNSEEKYFELDYNGKRYMVYAEEVGGGWKTFSLVNTEVFYRPLQVILSIWFLLTLLEAIIFFAVFYNLSSKNIAISIQNMQISAVADMYISIYDIDLPMDRIREIQRDNRYDMAHVIGENQNSAQSALNELFVKGVNEASKPAMDQFLDVQTLSERLAEVDTITEEFLDDQKRWCRGRFVVANRDRDGAPTRVLWMVESIDEEKKHRDNLKRLSETDRMTGLLNRATGESKIDELLEGGNGGMLLMIDADRFKSINDGYGHDVGDKVIIAIAQALKDAFRRSDIVMRLGGDEFVAYTPEVVSEGQGRIIVNRLFNKLEHYTLKEMGGHHVYVSVGAAICKAGEIRSFAELYKRADTCTYESKKKTGNVCTFYKGE